MPRGADVLDERPRHVGRELDGLVRGLDTANGDGVGADDARRAESSPYVMEKVVSGRRRKVDEAVGRSVLKTKRSEEPVSKSRWSVCVPMVTGDRYSTLLVSAVAVTRPVRWIGGRGKSMSLQPLLEG